MKLYTGEAIDILFKTMPYVLMRAAVYFACGLVGLAYFGLLLLVGHVFSWNAIALVMFVIGTIGFFVILRLVREYVLYLLKAGHVAVITELVLEGRLPDGIDQVAYGKQKVVGLFKEVSVLFVVDRLVHAVLRTFTRWATRIAGWLPIPGLEAAAGFIGTVAQLSIGFVDEAVLSYSLAKKQANIWQGAKEGIILFCQQWKPIVLNASVMAVFSYLSFFVFFLPGLFIASVLHGTVTRYVVGAVFLLLALVVKFGFINPLALVTTIVTFQKEVAGMVPNPEWEAKLSGISKKFRQITDRARSYVPPAPAPTPGSGPGTPA